MHATMLKELCLLGNLVPSSSAGSVSAQLRSAVSRVVFSDNPTITRIRQAGGTICYGAWPNDAEYRNSMAWDAAGNDVVREILARDEPCLISRMGRVELYTANFWLRWRRRALRPAYPAPQRTLMQFNAGFFPADDESLDRFSSEMIAALGQADALAVYSSRYEDVVARRYAPGAQLVELGALNCMCYPRPWSRELAGKRVLVVHPFADSIEWQYRHHRQVLFDDPEVLPAFDLQTLKPVQSSGELTTPYESWFEALEQMCDQISRRTFDVAIIGAGAYGLALGAFVKSMGGQAIHLGGPTQLLFGIKGRRWEDEYQDSIVPLFNDAWTRPLASEKPAGAAAIEQGCYW